jgi:integrase
VERYKNGYRVKRRGDPTYHLAGPDASRAEVWAAYEHWEAGQVAKAFIVAELIDLYFVSPQYTKHLQPSTQQDYHRYSLRVRKVFGEMQPDAITSPLVQMFLDARGADHPVAANRERTFLGIIMKWGKARGFVQIEDPTMSVRPFKEKPGGRYVEDWEYTAFWHWLTQRGHIMHACSMAISLICGSRQQDVLALTRADVLEDGLMIFQIKTGKRQVKLWTPELREVVKLALATNTKPKIQTPHIIRSRLGRRYTRCGFNSTWLREQREALAQGVIKNRFRYHDMKIKSISDFEGDIQRFSGHKTRSMAERYNRTADRVVSLNRPRKGKPQD